MRMRVCIVGAGAAGLASARQAQDQKYNHEYVIFERSGQIGGTWVYDERTGVDEFGLPIHTSMYKNLRSVDFSEGTNSINIFIFLQNKLAERSHGVSGLPDSRV